MTLPETRLNKTHVLMAILLLNGAAVAKRVDCEGTVLGPDRQPVEDASVSIYTAKMKIGISPYCPSCYADCRKRAQTDEKGRFVVPALDPELRFTILVVAEGCRPEFVNDVDPAEGPVHVVLSPLAMERLAPAHVLRGRVVDPDGNPVAGATVEPIGTAVPGTVVGFLPCDPSEVDPLAITNGRGEFFLTARAPNVTVWVTVRARGLAARYYPSLSAGGATQEIRLNRGCRLTGRLVPDGMSLEGVAIGVAQVDRRAGRFLGEYTTGLRKDGRFEINNLPSNEEYYVYGKMESLHGQGAVAVRRFRTGDDGSDVDASELTLERGHEVTVHVILSDGRPIPHKTRFLISRDDAWDTLICELDKDGRFSTRGLPPGVYRIAVLVTGYRAASANRGFAARDGFILRGMIDRDMTDLTVFMEPGKRGYSHSPEEPKKKDPALEAGSDAFTRFLKEPLWRRE